MPTPEVCLAKMSCVTSPKLSGAHCVLCVSFLRWVCGGWGGHWVPTAIEIRDLLIQPCLQNRNYKSRWEKELKPEPEDFL